MLIALLLFFNFVLADNFDSCVNCYQGGLVWCEDTCNPGITSDDYLPRQCQLACSGAYSFELSCSSESNGITAYSNCQSWQENGGDSGGNAAATILGAVLPSIICCCMYTLVCFVLYYLTTRRCRIAAVIFCVVRQRNYRNTRTIVVQQPPQYVVQVSVVFQRVTSHVTLFKTAATGDDGNTNAGAIVFTYRSRVWCR
jgi:hypothetical protein